MFFEPPEVGGMTQGLRVCGGRVGEGGLRRLRPLSGEVIEVNEALSDAPERINNDPYGEGWLVKVKLSDPSEVEALLDVAAYRELL